MGLKVVTLALLELVQVVVGPVITLQGNLNFKTIAEHAAHGLAKLVPTIFFSAPPTTSI